MAKIQAGLHTRKITTYKKGRGVTTRTIAVHTKPKSSSSKSKKKK